MLENLFYRNDGSLKSVSPNYDSEEALWKDIVECFRCMDGHPERQTGINEEFAEAEHDNAHVAEHCFECPYGDDAGDAFITRLNRWINLSAVARAEVKSVFFDKSDYELGSSLHNRNNTLASNLKIARTTLSGWRDGTRDPAKRANDNTSRENIYKLCFLLGLRSKNTIREFFTSVINAEAFTRLTELECCIEHFTAIGTEGWLECSFEVVENKYNTECPDGFNDEEDTLSSSSIIRNKKLTYSEFSRAINSTNHMKADVEKTRSRIARLGRIVYLMLNTKEDKELPADWTIKNKKIITPIFCGRFRYSFVLDKNLRNSAMNDLKTIGAARNFPTSKILNDICDGEANEEKIRRMFIFLIFAATFLQPSKVLDKSFSLTETNPEAFLRAIQDRTGELIWEFLDDCECLLERSRLRKLDVSDGFDALLLYCCCTSAPLDTLRRRLGYVRDTSNKMSV